MSEFRRRLLMQNALKGEPKPPLGKYIQFEDPEVERICMARFSSDGIGVTYADAEKVKSWNFGNISNIVSFKELKYFTNIKEIPEKAFLSRKKIKAIDLVNITRLNYASFAFCDNLTDLGDTSNIIQFGVQCFDRSSKITDFDFNENIKEIPSACFSSVPLDNVILNLPKVEKISDNALNGLKQLKELILPSIVTLGDLCFFNINAIEKVTLSNKLESIRQYAFANNEKLNTVILPTIVPPQIDSTLFSQGTPLKNGIYVPDQSVEAYKSAENWSSYADKIKPLSEYVPE